MNSGKVLIFCAPSGSGKSTVVQHLMGQFPELRFSISATSRAPRGNEVDGREYHFISEEEFLRRVEAGEFVEYEQVYAGSWYGTLRGELEKIWAEGGVVIFDVDVVGGVNLKKIFGADALSVFVQPPSAQELRRRLEGRGTDSAEAIERRLAKADWEMTFASKFDYVLVNDDLATALAEATSLVEKFLR